MKNINFVAIDFETANFEDNAPCKIGITIVKEGLIDKSFYRLVNPETKIIDYFSFIHGVTDEMVKNEPTFPEVWKELSPLLTEDTFLIAHGGSFDFKILINTISRYELSFPSVPLICSMVVSRKVFKEFPSFGLPWMSISLGYGWTGWEAKRNSELCAMIFLETCKRTDISNISSLLENMNISMGHISTNGVYKKCISKRIYKYRPQIRKEIIPETSKFDETHLFYEMNVVFTGKLSRIVRNEAHQMVADIGGFIQNDVTKTTDFLVVGQQDYRIVGDSGMSNKQEKAIKYKKEGLDIEILSENEFMELF